MDSIFHQLLLNALLNGRGPCGCLDGSVGVTLNSWQWCSKTGGKAVTMEGIHQTRSNDKYIIKSKEL